MIDSRGTFIAGYVVGTSIYVVYLITLWRRAKRVDELWRRAERRS
jgi:hypothetical protein